MASDFNARIKTKRPIWAAVGAIALALIAEGNQLGGAPNYILARACYVGAALSLAYGLYYWPRLRSDTGKLQIPTFLVLLVAMGFCAWWACKNLAPKPDPNASAATLGGIDGLLKKYFGQNPTSTHPSIPMREDNRNPNLPLNIATVTLEDLFFRDAVTGVETSICGGKTIHSPTLGDVHIRTCSSLGLGRNTVTASIYIPFWNDTISLCKELLRLVDVRQVIKDDLKIKVEGKEPGNSTTQTTEGIVFSGLLWVYHEKEMSAENLGDLTRLYAANGLKAQFRSQSYLEVVKLKAQLSK